MNPKKHFKMELTEEQKLGIEKHRREQALIVAKIQDDWDRKEKGLTEKLFEGRKRKNKK